jgi:kumamolisin
LELDVRPSAKLIVLAAAVAALAAAQPATATTTHAGVQAPTATLSGSVLPSVAHSSFVDRTPAAAPVRVSLILRPSHPRLLANLAAQSSGRPGLSQRVMNGLFRPNPNARAEVTAYMRAHGFQPAGSGMLAMSFRGSSAQAESAFGVTLNHYALADGTAYRAPSGAIHLPPSLAARVVSVDGLSTLPLMRPLGLHHVHHRAGGVKPRTTLNDCPGADGTGGLQPVNLAGPNAYNSASLVSGGNDGSGQSVALVEFSGYHNSDQATYQLCYGTSVPVSEVPVHGGTGTAGGGDVEVALDQEVLAGEAPGLDHIYTYVAPQTTSMAGVLDAIFRNRVSEGVHIVSDSWGNCEAVLLEADQAANNFELQLMAVAGMSFYAASGDDGSSDCRRSLGINNFVVDDPAVQPYATGVGGTNLKPGVSETVWGGHGAARGGGGGGVSLSFTMPGWQKGPGVIRTGQSSRKKCGGKTRWCREVPDVAFDADPNTGYAVFCTGCIPKWSVVGGTSAAAPLMAAFTAIANEYSQAHGGHLMGFANPFLYHQFKVDRPMFHDVTAGTNNIIGGSTYRAGIGYDLASGLGSINVNTMATDLAGYTRAKLTIHNTRITASASVNPVTAANPTVLSGKLSDTTTHTPLGGRVVWVEGFIGKSPNPVFLRMHTGRKGKWSTKLTKKQLGKRFIWHAVYVGETGHRPAVSPTHILKIG